MNEDPSGYWAEKFPGFQWIQTGFRVNPSKKFLSSLFCQLYAIDIRKQKRFKEFSVKMSVNRIAAEIYAHALAYYVGDKLKYVSKRFENYFNHGKIVDVNYDDPWAYKYWAVWSVRGIVKIALRGKVPFNIWIWM